MLADEDMRVSRHIMAMPDDCPHRLAAYHAQQCAEKYLKAYLVFHGVDFPFTHNIARLLELCSEQSGWAAGLGEAEELTPFVISVRYPGEDEPVSEAEAHRAIDIAGCVRRTVREALDKEGLMLKADS